jgi:hypothetical protein
VEPSSETAVRSRFVPTFWTIDGIAWARHAC